MSFLIRLFAVATLSMVIVQGCFGRKESEPVRVLVWNLWHGGNEVNDGPEKALQVIKDSQADICLLQESHDIKGPRPKFGLWAAEELGWQAWMGKSSHLCVLTRFNIRKKFLQAKKHCVGVELEDGQGRTLHAFSVWIDSKDCLLYTSDAADE